MTEWIILIKMIIDWKKSLKKDKTITSLFAYKFLVSMEFWVFFNLIFALLISIPYLNFFTHGTHITVAHSMGTTIGINTSILLASVLFIAQKTNLQLITNSFKQLKLGYWVFNSSLMVFLVCLFLAGVKKSVWLFFTDDPSNFGSMQDSLSTVMLVFLLSGIGVFIGLLLLTFPALKVFIKKLKSAN